MNITYDIFDLADIPIVVTDENFVITYKNHLAHKLFVNFRKRSKISKHFRNFKNDTDFSNISELDIETGTQFMRALAFSLENKSIVFLFLTLYSFVDSKKFLNHVREKFNGNIFDFYASAYNEHAMIEKMPPHERAKLPVRAYSELLFFLSSYSEKPEFMCKEMYDISEILAEISYETASSLTVFGISATYDEPTHMHCYFKTNLKYFSFIIFRMIYIAIKFSSAGKIHVSLNNEDFSFADICVYTNTSLDDDFSNTRNILELIKLLPEFSFEANLLNKIDMLKDDISFSVHNSVLKIHYKIKCETGFEFILRSEPKELRQKRISAIISNALLKTKALLSEK